MSLFFVAGPLATLLWSHAFTTDGVGIAQIPPLEAGPQEVRIPGAPGNLRLIVPPLTDRTAKPATLRVVK